MAEKDKISFSPDLQVFVSALDLEGFRILANTLKSVVTSPTNPEGKGGVLSRELAEAGKGYGDSVRMAKDAGVSATEISFLQREARSFVHSFASGLEVATDDQKVSTKATGIRRVPFVRGTRPPKAR